MSTCHCHCHGNVSGMSTCHCLVAARRAASRGGRVSERRDAGSDTTCYLPPAPAPARPGPRLPIYYHECDRRTRAASPAATARSRNLRTAAARNSLRNRSNSTRPRRSLDLADHRTIIGRWLSLLRFPLFGDVLLWSSF